MTEPHKKDKKDENMAYKTFTAKMNDEEIKKKLTELAELTSDLKPLFRVLRQTILSAIYDNFDTEGTASGDKWEELSKDYKARKVKEYGEDKKILEVSGHLKTSFIDQVKSDSLTIGSPEDYAAVHNFGYEDRNIPKREIIRFSDQQIEDIVFEIHWWYLKNIKYAIRKI